MVNLFNGWDLNLDEKKKAGFKEEDKEGKKAKFDPRKTRIPSFEDIKSALSKASYGQIFTTPQSNNIYVITRGTWGEKSKDKAVKSFPLVLPMRRSKRILNAPRPSTAERLSRKARRGAKKLVSLRKEEGHR